MKEKKHIDRLYQEKFKHFEVSPRNEVWHRIHKSLSEKHKKRPALMPLWWRITGVAAALVFLVSLGLSVYNQSANKEIYPVVNSENNTKTTQPDASYSKENRNSKIKEETDLTKENFNSSLSEQSSNNKSPIPNNKQAIDGNESNNKDGISYKNKINNPLIVTTTFDVL